MQTIVIVIHLMVVSAMIGVVLLQRSEGGGLGMGGGGGEFMTSRGTANVLTRATAVLAMVFFATSLVLSILAGIDRKPKSIMGTDTTTPTSSGDTGGKSVLDTLKQMGEPQRQPQPPQSQ